MNLVEDNIKEIEEVQEQESKEELINGLHKFEQDNGSIIEVMFNNGKTLYVKMIKDDKITSSYSFNNDGKLHGEIIMEGKKYNFNNGSMN